MAGLHFRFATDAGLQLGRQVGGTAATQILQPLADSAANDQAFGYTDRSSSAN